MVVYHGTETWPFKLEWTVPPNKDEQPPTENRQETGNPHP
jgi:hypothetical protein